MFGYFDMYLIRKLAVASTFATYYTALGYLNSPTTNCIKYKYIYGRQEERIECALAISEPDYYDKIMMNVFLSRRCSTAVWHR